MCRSVAVAAVLLVGSAVGSAAGAQVLSGIDASADALYIGSSGDGTQSSGGGTRSSGGTAAGVADPAGAGDTADTTDASPAPSEEPDPLDIVLAPKAWRYWALGDFVREVWVCGGHNAGVTLDPAHVAERLNFWLRPYFRQLSANRFNVRFVVGGRVKTNSQCGHVIRTAAAADTSVNGNGAVVAYETTAGDGYTTYAGKPRSYPDNAREVYLNGGAVDFFRVSGMKVAAHEILHQTYLAHSYGRSDSEYDNPMDVISGGQFIGTAAPNRYANGWIDSSEVVVHPQISGAVESVTYELFRPGVKGTQMLVLPRPDGYSCGSWGSAKCFWALGARIRSGLDLYIPAEGVEVYNVSQAGGGGYHRRTEPAPPLPDDWEHDDRENNYDHVYGVGGSHTIRGWRFEVMERHRDSYEVWVGDKDAPGSIASDSFSVTETDGALSLSWTAPADNGRALRDYTVQWRLASAASDASWNSIAVTAPVVSHTITGSTTAAAIWRACGRTTPQARGLGVKPAVRRAALRRATPNRVSSNMTLLTTPTTPLPTPTASRCRSMPTDGRPHWWWALSRR